MIKERIIQILEYKGIAKENFYTEIGMTSASFRGKAKESPLNSNAIENILSIIPEINPEWLLTGKGSMLKEEKEVKTPIEATPTTTNCQETKALAEDRAYIIELQKEKIHHLEQELADLQRTLQAKKTI